ncbi:hypothetical protein [Myxococcus sp. SDU36]|uniref:hypothetical protein n=1 Tax=Myxococcus sp. SDU36 TaxID=2831967 RepID=UPI002542FD3B|nr:hypothetical protein [Myxococcus sp. SDU36]WIG94638.1 hypothetical protein KGD87_29605 [Myxococcus sp. SDU36]
MIAADPKWDLMRSSPFPRPIHPFPARMAASIPWDELQSPTPLRVLDPMAGSGTAAVIARILGHEAIGMDMDPLAVQLAQGWCTAISAAAVRMSAASILKQVSDRWKSLRGDETYPQDADDETRKFVRYWFDITNRRQLRAFADSIGQIDEPDIQRVLWIAFSRLIITKEAGVSWARDLAHSRPHKVLKEPERPLNIYLREIEKVLQALQSVEQSASGRPLSEARIRRGDARDLADIQSSSIDAIVTSPPYLNAIDYIRTSKFTLVWQGHPLSSLRRTRSQLIGTEVQGQALADAYDDVAKAMGAIGTLPQRQQRLLFRYVDDMNRVFREFSRVLVPGGRVILVIGDCAVRGVRIRNSSGLDALAKRHGLTPLKHNRRILPANRRYLPPPSNGRTDLNARMRTEVVLRFQKSIH